MTVAKILLLRWDLLETKICWILSSLTETLMEKLFKLFRWWSYTFGDSVISKSIPWKSISMFAMGPEWGPLPWVIGSSCKTEQTFGERVWSLDNNTEWPMRSLELIPCDFFLWGYLKDKVFRTPPESLNVLLQRIITEGNLRENKDWIRSVQCMQSHATCEQRGGIMLRGICKENDKKLLFCSRY